MISRIHYEYGRTNVPRLPTGVMLTQHELDMFAGGKGSWDRLISKLSPTAFKRTKLAGRVATKTTVRHIASEVAVDQVVTNAARHGARLGPLPRDEGSDLDMLPSDYEDEEESLDQLLTRIFNQFKIDVMCQIPNPREDSEFVYSELRMSERKNNVDQYMVHERNLAVIFNQVMVRQGDSDSWKAAFRHYFPKERKAQPSSAQGFHTWYKRWMAIRSRLSPRSLQAARTELWLQFRKLRWVPMATSDRLWCSARLTSNYELYPEGATYQIAPRILLNYRFSDWHFTLVRNRLHPAPRHLSAIERANLAQEEEEDSEEEVDMQL